MQRQEITPEFQKILKTAFALAGDVAASALLILADRAYDFASLKRESKGFRLIVASDKKDVQEAVRLDDVDVVEIQQEPQSRHIQVSQILIEAMADELLQTGDVAVVVPAVSGSSRKLYPVPLPPAGSAIAEKRLSST